MSYLAAQRSRHYNLEGPWMDHFEPTFSLDEPTYIVNFACSYLEMLRESYLITELMLANFEVVNKSTHLIPRIFCPEAYGNSVHIRKVHVEMHDRSNCVARFEHLFRCVLVWNRVEAFKRNRWDYVFSPVNFP